MIQINQCKLPVGHTQEELSEQIRRLLRLDSGTRFTFEIRKRSIDARQKPDLYYVYQIWVQTGQEKKILERCRKNTKIQRAEESAYIPPYPIAAVQERMSGAGEAAAYGNSGTETAASDRESKAGDAASDGNSGTEALSSDRESKAGDAAAYGNSGTTAAASDRESKAGVAAADGNSGTEAAASDWESESGDAALCGNSGTTAILLDKKIQAAVPAGRAVLDPPVIIGAGPAGLFCAWLLTEAGMCPIVIERGRRIEERSEDVRRFWETGVLDPDSNVQFGEGGAGTFSDGKLNTAVKDPKGRIRYILETFVRFGAPSEILYDQKPHIGTDVLASVIRNMRDEMIARGCCFRFETCAEDFWIEGGKLAGVIVRCPDRTQELLRTDRAVLAIGHSARDTFVCLHRLQIPMEVKDFAVGFRVEHPQEMINTAMYGDRCGSFLPAAPYKLTSNFPNGRGVYSFCMCPGGFVVNAASGPRQAVVNGMSYSGRDGANANSAIIITVTPKDFLMELPSDLPEKWEAAERRGSAAGGVGNGRSSVAGGVGNGRSSVVGEIGKCQVSAAGEVENGRSSVAVEIGNGQVSAAGGVGNGRSSVAGVVCGRISFVGTGIDRQADPLAGMRYQEHLERKAWELAGGKIPQQLLGDYREGRLSRSYGDFASGTKGQRAFADLRGLFSREMEEAFLLGIEQFARRIPGFDRPDAILSGVESRTSSPLRILRDTGMESTVRGIYPCGEGAGYAGGIMSAAIDGMKVAERILCH